MRYFYASFLLSGMPSSKEKLSTVQNDGSSPVATNNSERRDNQTFTPETDVGLLSHTQ